MSNKQRGKMVNINCLQCHTVKSVREAAVKRDWGRFCGKSCKALHQAAKRIRGEYMPMDRHEDFMTVTELFIEAELPDFGIYRAYEDHHNQPGDFLFSCLNDDEFQSAMNFLVDYLIDREDENVVGSLPLPKQDDNPKGPYYGALIIQG